MKRQTLIRLLIVVGIGIPLLVEGITFVGLLEAEFLGSDGDITETPTWTPAEGALSEGDELLAQTAQTELLSTTSIVTEGDERVLTLTVLVENPTNATYEFRFDAVTTGGGQRIEGGDSTGAIPPGERGVVTAQWRLSRSEYPKTVSVTARIETNGTADRVEATLPLARIPIED